jgi:hypothetical protein
VVEIVVGGRRVFGIDLTMRFLRHLKELPQLALVQQQLAFYTQDLDVLEPSGV